MNSKKKPENIQYYALKSDLFGNFDEIDKRKKKEQLVKNYQIHRVRKEVAPCQRK